jgi:hypothetical protein
MKTSSDFTLHNRFEITIVPDKFISREARLAFQKAQFDLQLIKEKLNLHEIAIRGGFVIDTLIGKKSKDIDLFYISKSAHATGKQECTCKKFEKQYSEFSIETKLLKNFEKVDWGHYGKNEVVLPIEQGICGYLTQSLDFLSVFALDSKGNIWTNKFGLHCLETKTWEITPMTWMTYIYFMADGKVDFYDLYVGIGLKIIRHLKEGKASSIGPMTRELLENLYIPLSTIRATKTQKKRIIGKFNKNEIPLQIVSRILTEQRISNRDKIISELKRFV